MTYPPPNGVPPHQPYPYGPPPGYPPTQYHYPPNQPPPSKGLGVGKVLLIIAAAVVGFIVFIGVLGAALGSDKDEPVVTNIGATPSVVEDKPADPPTDKAAPIAGTITYPDGLAARISGVTSGPSSNQFDSDGPLTLISFELRATKDETLDAADWSPPYLNYGPGGTAAEHTIIAGDVNGISPADFSGTGLIQPGGVVTVTFAYEIPLDQLNSVTITPRWPGRMTWGGDLTTIPPSR